jgi:hypothetical protein
MVTVVLPITLNVMMCTLLRETNGLYTDTEQAKVCVSIPFLEAVLNSMILVVLVDP